LRKTVKRLGCPFDSPKILHSLQGIPSRAARSVRAEGCKARDGHTEPHTQVDAVKHHTCTAQALYLLHDHNPAAAAAAWHDAANYSKGF
jgi:hypothetical protein